MALIGEFEAAAKAADPDRVPDTFRLQGHTFTVAEDTNIIALGRFARAAREGADSDDMEGLAALIDTVASLVVPEDENRFLDVASKNRVDTDLLLKIVSAVLESQTGKATVQPSGSSGGSPTTTPSSRELSSSVASLTPRKKDWRDSPFGRRELAAHPELYEGFGTVAEQASRVVDLSSVG